MTALEERLLAAYEEPQEEQERERFSITDDDMAEWAMKKIAKAREAYAAKEAAADVQRKRIDEWLADERKGLERTEEFFSGLLTRYYLPQHEANPKQKTFKLPAGQVQFRQQQPDYVRDDDKLLAWLKGNYKTDYVQVTEKPKWAELKKQLKQHGERMTDPDSGEIVDGILVVEKGLKINVVTGEV